MLIPDFLAALVVALLFVALMVPFLGWRAPGREHLGPGGTSLFLFLLMFLFVWAAGVWVAPVGPAIRGVYFLNFVLVGTLLALLVFALSPPRTPAPAAGEEEGSGDVPVVGFGLLFWMLVLLLFMAAMFGYLLPQAPHTIRWSP